MYRSFPALILGLTLLLSACSDDSTGESGNQDTGTTHLDKDGYVDGYVKDRGSTPADKGATPADTGAPGSCGSEFVPKDACGGSLVGTWKYVAGCVEPSTWAELKSKCPGFTATKVKFAIDPKFNALTFTPGGKFTRAIKGTIAGTGHFPATCAKLGCKVLESAIKLTAPLATVTCAKASAGGCSCTLSVPLAHVGAGSYTTKGGDITVTGGAKTLPYFFCVKGNQLRYRGTTANSDDRHVTFMLTK
jgi:hypothetical protein